jgi:hypothetical protein
LLLGSLLAALVAAGFGLDTARWLDRARERVVGHRKALQTLNEVMAEYQPIEAALNRLDAGVSAGGSTSPLEAMLKTALPSANPANENLGAVDVGAWMVEQREISLTSVSFAEAMQFVDEAESASPPWRLVECTLRAGDGQEKGKGRGNVVLVMARFAGR